MQVSVYAVDIPLPGAYCNRITPDIVCFMDESDGNLVLYSVAATVML